MWPRFFPEYPHYPSRAKHSRHLVSLVVQPCGLTDRGLPEAKRGGDSVEPILVTARGSKARALSAVADAMATVAN